MAAADGENGAIEEALPERLLVSVLAVGAVAIPYLLRGLDDSRLTSWSWVFGARSPAALFGLAAAAALAAHALARALPARRPTLVLFLCAYGVGACFWREPEPIVDAARYFVQAKHLELHGPVHFLREWGRAIPAWTDLPLVPFLYGVALRLSGESRLALEAVTTLLFAGTAVLTSRIGTALWGDEEAGFAAGAFLLAIPYLLTQVPLALVDVPTMFFLALAVHATLAAVRRGGRAALALAGGAVFLALASKYSAWLFLTVVPVAALAEPRGRRRAALARAGGVAAVAAALALAAALPRLDVFARQAALLAGYQAPGLRRWGESFLSTFLFQVHPFVGAAAIASAWVAFRRRDARWIVAAWPVLLLLALGVRRIRYLVPAFPMLALLAAYGLQALRSRETRRAVLACAVLSSLAVGLGGFLPFLRSTSAANLQAAGAYLDSLAADRVEVLTAYAGDPEVNPAVSVPILDLFTTKPLVYGDEGIARPSGPRAAISPLRFTWEMGIAPFYAPRGPEGAAAVAVITDGGAALPPRVTERLRGYVLDRAFTTGEDPFQHATQVQVWIRSAPIAGAGARGG
jgi:4-amino-4-deoxy-L-arabinose transferase-like glycosyltransferase